MVAMENRVWVSSERAYRQFGDIQWECSWEDVKPVASARIREAESRGELIDIDPDTDLVYHTERFTTWAAAHKFARKLVDQVKTAYGQVAIQKQRVDWLIKSEQVADWIDVGEPEHVN